MNTKPEKQLVITTNVKIDIKNERNLETDLLQLNQTKSIQSFWSKKKKWITFWTIIRWFIFIGVMILVSKAYFSTMSFWLGILAFAVCLGIMIFAEMRLVRKHIEDYPEKLRPVLAIYRQTLLSPFLELRMEKFANLLSMIFPNADVNDLDRDLDRAYDADEVIHITGCSFCKFDYLIIEEQLGKSYPLFDYKWRIEMDVFLQKNISLREMYLDKHRNVVLVIKGDGLQHLILEQEYMIKSKVYTEVW